jgi:hypothetical protein
MSMVVKDISSQLERIRAILEDQHGTCMVQIFHPISRLIPVPEKVS